MKPQKAQHKYLADELKNPKYIGHKYLMLPKIDGWYGYYDIGAGSGISSNAQRVIPSCMDRTRALACKTQDVKVPEGRLIFELTVDGTPQFEQMNGILNRKAICHEIRLNVHDFIPKDLGVLTYERYRLAESIVESLDLEWMELIPALGVSEQPAVWESKAAQLIDKGAEGLILKKLQAGYSPGVRCADLMKIKEECEFDLLVTGFVRGTLGSKYQDTVGALTVMDAVGKKFTISGMTDDQRKAWWYHSNLIVGKVVKVKAKNVMKDGSLREPRFNVIRFDKNKDDINEVK